MVRKASCMLTLVVLALGGCDKSGSSKRPGPLLVQQCGELPGLRAAADVELRDELARIVEEGGTPAQLERPPLAAEENVAMVLVDLFPTGKIGSIRGKSDKIFPPGKFELSPSRLQKAKAFLKRYDKQRLRVRDALELKQCDFGIRFSHGSFADWTFIDVIWIVARLEAFAAAESLAADQPAPAIESLECMLRWASCLAAEMHVVTRLEAAFIRTEAFSVLQAIAINERTDDSHLEQLYAMVEKYLREWPDDADAWIGDRAVGMHTYEVVRAGHMGQLLTAGEMQAFGREGGLKNNLAAAEQGVDQDELYYLNTMRKVIESCARPYHERTGLFESVFQDLHNRRNSDDFPLVAARLLLRDIRKGHQIQTQDRANAEAWLLALALAVGRPMPSGQTNPLTGERYEQDNVENEITVWNFGTGEDGDDPAITIPVPQTAKQ